MADNGKKETGTAGVIIAALLLIGYAAVCLWFGVKGLFFSKEHPMEDVFKYAIEGDTYEGSITRVDASHKSVENMIRYRWAGTHHFFVIVSEDGERAMLVRAPKKWTAYAGKSFDAQETLESGGMVKHLHVKTRKKLSDLFSKLEQEGLRINTGSYLDIYSRKVCMAQVFFGISTIVCAIYYTILCRKALRAGPYAESVVNGTELQISKPLLVFMIGLTLVTFGVFMFLRNMM